MTDELEAYIIRENIKLYRRRLEVATDERERRTLLKLLFKEEEKQKRLQALPSDRPNPPR